MDKISVAIQAGGNSKRMGRDKGLLPFGGVTLVEYIFNQVSDLGGVVFIISNRPSNYTFLGLPVYSDVYQDVGSLGGIHTSLTYMPGDFVLLLACDMPFINLDLISHMISICVESDVVIPAAGKHGHLEPFRAIYSKRCLPFVEDAIRAGQRRAISFFDQVYVKKLGTEIIRRYDSDEISFLNINTPEDYLEILTRV